jgi:hypothetical protein
MLKKTTNPPMPSAPRERGPSTVKLLVEGEDFHVTCPDWCEPIPAGAWPTERGWYLGVSLVQSTDDDFKPKPPELEVLWLEQTAGLTLDGWCVNEVATDKVCERRDFWWVGRIKMPDVMVIKGED